MGGGGAANVAQETAGFFAVSKQGTAILWVDASEELCDTVVFIPEGLNVFAGYGGGAVKLCSELLKSC